MRITAARTLFVLAALTTLQFIEGGRLVFLPSVNLWNWCTEAVRDIGGNNLSIYNQDFLWNVASFFLVPIAFACWFKVGDMLRMDINGVRNRSKYLLHVLIPIFSWSLMVFAISYSINNGGPITLNHWFTQGVNQVVYGSALGLLVIEYITYIISSSKS